MSRAVLYCLIARVDIHFVNFSLTPMLGADDRTPPGTADGTSSRGRWLLRELPDELQSLYEPPVHRLLCTCSIDWQADRAALI